MTWHHEDDIESAFTDEFLWPDDLEGPWLVRLGWREIAGRMECVALAIEEWEPFDPESGHTVKAELVHRLPVGGWMKDARKARAGSAEVFGALHHEEGDHAGAAAEWKHGRKFVAPQKRAGRPKAYGDEHFRDVASVYADAWRSGDPPTKAVAEHFQVSHSTAARWVRECRGARGFLGKTEKRKAGGILPDNPQEER